MVEGISPQIALQVGGWVFAALVLGAILQQVITGGLVRGALLDRSLTQQEKALPAIEANTGSLKQMLDVVHDLKEAVDRLERRVDEMRR